MTVRGRSTTGRETINEQKTVRVPRADKEKTNKERTKDEEKTKKRRRKDEQKTNNERRITRVKIYLNCIQSGALVEKTYFFEIIFRSFKKK